MWGSVGNLERNEQLVATTMKEMASLSEKEGVYHVLVIAQFGNRSLARATLSCRVPKSMVDQAMAEAGLIAPYFVDWGTIDYAVDVPGTILHSHFSNCTLKRLHLAVVCLLDETLRAGPQLSKKRPQQLDIQTTGHMVTVNVLP